jgi:hypothetical protein
VVLDRGAIVASGPAAEVLSPMLIRRVFQVEAVVLGNPLTAARCWRSPDTTLPEPAGLTGLRKHRQHELSDTIEERQILGPSHDVMPWLEIWVRLADEKCRHAGSTTR